MHNVRMLTFDDIARRLSRPRDANGRGDHDLNPDLAPEDPLRPAAVLVALVARDDGPSVLLTRRTDHLAHHPGQISFPGGHIEDGDAGAQGAALREAFEEIGLAPERVRVLGRLDDYVTRTGFHVTPIVGWVEPPLALAPDPHEVEEVFEVPLAFFLDPANHQRHQRPYEGRSRQFYAMPYGDYYIWGATAGMLVNLYQVLADTPMDAANAS